MAISKLSAGSQGTGTNSTGGQLVSSVNSIIDKIETTGMTRDNMSDQYIFKNETITDLNALLKDGTYSISSPANRPDGIGQAILRVTIHTTNWQLQEIFGMFPESNQEMKWYRLNKPTKDGHAMQWGKWQRGKPRHHLEGKKVVFLGDSITASYSMTYYFQTITSCEVVNGAIGGSRAGHHTLEHYDELSGHKIAEAISSGNWTSVTTAGNALNVLDGSTELDTRMADLAALDWGWNNADDTLAANEVDYLVVGLGTNDFGGSVPLGSNDGNMLEFYPAYQQMVIDIITAHPHLKILWWLPIWRGYGTVDTNNGNSPILEAGGSNLGMTNAIGNTLQQYIDIMKEILEAHNQPYINMHEVSGINQHTVDHYLRDDHLHPEKAGAKHIAEKLIAGLKANFE